MRIVSSLYDISSFQVKKMIVDDPRYDAVGSSTLREELFNTFLKAYETSNLQTPKPEPGELNPNAQEEIEGTETSEADHDRERLRRERKDRAVKERENKIRAERSKVEADIDKSRQGLNKSENELEFRCAAYIAFFLSSYMAPLTV